MYNGKRTTYLMVTSLLLLHLAVSAQSYYPGGLPSSVINVWHDASDPSSLTYSIGTSYAATGLTGSGTISTNTITTTATVNGLASGNIIRWGSNTVDYTVQSVSGTTITLTANLLATFTAQTINRKDSNLVSQWRDKSGKNMHALQATVGSQPMLNTLNGKNIVEFYGPKNINIASNAYLDPSTGYNLAQAVFVYNDAPTSVTDFRYGTYTRNTGGMNTNTPIIGLRYITGDGKYEAGLSQNNSGLMVTGIPDLRNQWSLLENYVPVGYNKEYLTVNGGNTVSNGNYTVAFASSANAVSIGNRTTYPIPVHWGVSETILTGSPIGNSGRKILETYLAWKWGMQAKLPSALLNLFNPSNSSFSNKIVGIGKEANGDSIVSTGSNDGLGFSNTSFLKDSGDYIIAAHNGLTSTSSIATDFTRSNRIWYLSKTDASNNGGNINLFFNFTAIGLTLDTTTYNYSILFNATDPTFATGTNSFITTNSFTQDISGTQLSYSIDAVNLSTGYYTVVYTPKATTTFSTIPYAPAGFAKSQFNLWFDASDTSTITQSAGSISKWTDKVNGLQAIPTNSTYNPVLSVLNGKNIIEFNGIKNLNIADNALLDPTDGYHLAQSVFVYSDAPTSLTDSRYGTYTRNTFGSNTPQLSVRYLAADSKYEAGFCRNNSGYIIGGFPDLRGSWSVLQNDVPLGYAKSYVTLNGGGNENDTASFVNFTNAVTIGNRNTYPAAVHWGIGETLLTGSAVGNSGRKIIASYMGWKWGMQSKLNAFQLALFNPSDSNYAQKIIGIGTESGSDSISYTATHEGLSIANVNSTAGFLREAGDYILAGHNGATGTATIGTYFTKWNRAWFINKTDVGGFGGNINLAFDFAEYGINGFLDMLSKKYYLLYNPTNGAFNSGNNYIIPITSYQKINGTAQISFALDAINLPSGYYTIVYGNSEKPTSSIPYITNFISPTITVSPAPIMISVLAGNTVNYLNWNADSIGYAVVNYKIYVSLNGGAVALLDSVAPTQTNYAHYNLTNGSSYTYTVVAQYAPGKQSVASNSITGVPNVNTPVWAAKPQYAGNGKVLMKGLVATMNYTPFKYYYEIVSGSGHTSGYQSNAAYSDTGLTNGSTYSYRYKYMDSTKGASTESGWSSTETVTLYDSCRGGFTYNLAYLDPNTIDPRKWGIYPTVINPLSPDTTGLRFIKHAPAFGIHPRMYCNPEDTTEIKNRLNTTYSGRAISRFIHANTTLIQLGQSGYNKNGAYNKDTLGAYILGNVGANDVKSYYDKLAVGDTTGYYNLWGNNSTKLSYQLSFEAFECWLYKGTTDATTGTSYTTRATKLGNAILTWARACLKDPNPANALNYNNRDRIGGFNMAIIYDFLYPQMTTNQRDTIRLVLSKIACSPSDLHGFDAPSYTCITNHATFGYEIFPNMAIEGETGYTARVDSGLKSWVKTAYNFFNHGMYAPTGNFYEAIGKDQITGTLLVMLAKRGYSFFGHPAIKNYGKKYLPAITQPFGYSFIGTDLIGGTQNVNGTYADDAATGGYRYNAMDIVGLKWMYPRDTAIDFVWKNYIQRQKANAASFSNYYNYGNFAPNLAYFNYNIPGAIYASDYFQMPFTTQAQAANGNNKLYFDSLGGYAVLRSGFDSTAATLFYHNRQDMGGHTLPNKNNISFSAMGRIWIPSATSNGNSQFGLVTTANSFSGILVNGYGIPSDSTGSNANANLRIAPGKVVYYNNSPNLLSIAGDVKESFSNLWSQGLFTSTQENPYLFAQGASKVLESQNSFRYASGFSFDNYSFYNQLAFNDTYTPVPLYSKIVRVPTTNQMQKVFRTIAMVPSAKPYVLIADDVQKNNSVNNYKWIAQLAKDLTYTTSVSLVDSNYKNDLIFAEPAGTGNRRFLVRILNNTGAINPAVPGVTDSFNIVSPKRLIVESNSIDPKFRILLFAYNNGDALPKTKWNAAHDTLQVGFADSIKTFAFVIDGNGRTNINLLSTVKNNGFATPAAFTQTLMENPNATPATFNIYPNPIFGTDATVQLKGMAKGVYTIKVVNNSGVFVQQSQLNHAGGNAAYFLKVPRTKGIYTIELIGKTVAQYQKIIVQ